MSDDDSSSSSSSNSSSNNDFLVAKSKAKRNNTSDDEDINDSLQINTKYASEYESRKRREELSNYRQLTALEGLSSDDESSSESEDEDGELLTPGLDAKIVKTLRALKSKDEGIYDKNVTFFQEEEEEAGTGGKDGKVKAMRYKDVVREHILEEIEADEKGAALKDNIPRKQVNSRDFAYDVEQREIREAFLESTRDKQDEDGGESEDENWLKPKAKTQETEDDQAEVKRLWEEEFSSKSAVTADSKLVDPKGEVQDPDKFLMNFMSNRKWVDTTDVALRKIREVDEESIESFQDKMDDFESKYNFRFEEAALAGNEHSGASHSIVHYARGSVGDNVLRRKDETRRQKRLSRKERKAEERKAKEEQLRRLKNAKREELEERMQQVRNVLGYDTMTGGDDPDKHALGAAEEEMILKLMEGDYDPEKFEQVMSAAYGDDYYHQEDEKWKSDMDVKSDLVKGVEDSDVVGDGDMYDDFNEEVEKNEDGYLDDDGGNEEEIYDDEEAQWETEQYEESGMEKKLKSKMMDELYKLDYEDIIGDMPTRFKYRSVEPNSYGLSTEEILFANDSSLKQFVSLKKMAPYRDEGEYQPGTKKRKRFRQMLKSDKETLTKSEHSEESNVNANTNEESIGQKKKRRRQKKGSKKITNESDQQGDNSGSREKNVKENIDGGEAEKDHMKKKSKSDRVDEIKASLSSSSNVLDPSEEKSKHSHKGISKGEKKKRKKSSRVEGVSASRLSSYGL